MVRSVLSLRAQPGRGAEVVALFEELGILREASIVPGFVAAELQAVADDPDELLVTATWRSAAAYDAWLESPVRELMRPALEALLERPPVPRVYELVQTHP
jgi:heme-degrading monooxygenase HmoA